LNPELEKKIFTQFSDIFDTESNSHIWVRDGWLELINEMLESIYEYSKTQMAIQDCEAFPAKNIQIGQIKEKFGLLQVSTNSSDGYVQLTISDAKEKALRTCDICGQPGRLNKYGVHRVRCDEHLEEY
jgi:hypothetical protein